MHRLSSLHYRYRSSIAAAVASTALLAAIIKHSKFETLSTVSTTNAMMMSTTSSSSTATATLSGKKGALIFLHGLGDGSPNGWETSLEQQLTRFNSKLSSQNLVYIFPNAPILPISINGGTQMPGWFDLYDWPIDLDSRDDDVHIEKSITSTNDIVTKCMTDYNFSSKQIILAGFSQGGAIALLTAFHPKYKMQQDGTLGGCINLSGWLPLREKKNEWNEPSIPISTEPHVPLFWGHGQYDEIVLLEHQKAGIDFLTERGLVTPSTTLTLQYPVGHSSDPNEMKAMADFIDRILFNENDATTSSRNKYEKSKTDEL